MQSGTWHDPKLARHRVEGLPCSCLGQGRCQTNHGQKISKKMPTCPWSAKSWLSCFYHSYFFSPLSLDSSSLSIPVSSLLRSQQCVQKLCHQAMSDQMPYVMSVMATLKRYEDTTCAASYLTVFCQVSGKSKNFVWHNTAHMPLACVLRFISRPLAKHWWVWVEKRVWNEPRWWACLERPCTFIKSMPCTSGTMCLERSHVDTILK